MVLLSDEAQEEAGFGPFEIVLILTQDRCMVCAKCTIGQNLFWTHSMVLLGGEAQVKAGFGPFEYSANLVLK
jgi:hypothetical protein